jgi:2-polyprenyl-3-methyl-5-hydroxy-6-metoxy-1,4-benzoquinol methylase
VLKPRSVRPPFRFDGLLTRPLIRARLRAVRPLLPAEGRLLDVGCGLTDLPGVLGGYLGCDRSEEILAENAKRHPGARFIRWDVEASPAPEEVRGAGPFEAILMLALLEHLRDPGTTLARVGPLLSPNGRILVTTPHPAGRLPLEAGAALGLLSRHAAGEHEELLSRAGLERAGVAAGLRLVSYRRFLLGLNQVAVFGRAE